MMMKEKCGLLNGIVEKKVLQNQKKENLQIVLKGQVLIGGIGRELYTAPPIKIWLKDKEGNPNYTLYKKDNGRITTYTKFYVEAIQITNKEITALSIKNDQNKRVYVWKKQVN